MTAKVHSGIPPQRVVCAAIRHDTGRIICAPRHFDSLMHDQIKASIVPGWKNAEQGFVDQHGTFLTRKDALMVAWAANQVVRRCGGDEQELFSENLY